MKKSKKTAVFFLVALSFALGLVGPLAALAGPTKIELLSADNFAILAGSTITNIGSSIVGGDLGLSPGTAVTGFPPGIVNGTQHVANAVAAQAQLDVTTAYTTALGFASISTIPTELGGTTKTPGVYDSAAGTFGITGTLTLDGEGDANAVFIFKTATTFIMAAGSKVVLVNGAQACNIVWQVGSSATLGTNSTLQGSILAFTSATLNTGAHVQGRVLARNGAVTLDSSTVTKATCAVPVVEPIVVSAPQPTSTPNFSTSTPTSVIIPSFSTSTSMPAPSTTPLVFSATVTASPTLNVAPLVSTFIPDFPNTGLSPQETSMWWGSRLFVASALLILTLLLVILKKRSSSLGV